MKSIGLLGSTGSIGVQTLQVIDTFPGEYDIKYLTANKNVKQLPYRSNLSPRRLLVFGVPKFGFYLEQATIRE